MAESAWHAMLPLGAYAVGSFVTAYYLVRLRTGDDIRTLGTGNVGARNAGRVLGSWAFGLVFALDAGKGSLATWAARRWTGDELIVVAAMAAVVAGHVWPAQLRFRGGKGAATAAGALLVYDYFVSVTLMGLALLLLAATRRVSVSGLIAIGAAPVVAGLFGHGLIQVAGLGVMSAIVLLAHRVDPVMPAGGPVSTGAGSAT